MKKSPLGSLGVVVSLGVHLAACASESPGEGADRARLRPEAGEELPGGETTNTLLFGTKAFTRAVDNVTPEHERLFFSGNSFFSSAWVEAPASTTDVACSTRANRALTAESREPSGR